MKKLDSKKLVLWILTAAMLLSLACGAYASEDDDAPDIVDGAEVSEPVSEPEPAPVSEPVSEPEYTEPEESYEEAQPAEETQSITITPGETVTPAPESTESASDGGSGYVSGSYSQGYANTWVNTGDQRWDMLKIALTQVGYRETANHTKYNVWYFGYDCGESWCAIFLSWCAAQAGIPSYVLNPTAVANPESFGLGYRSVYYNDVQAGDLAFIENDGSNGYAGFDHVGLVYYVDENYIYTVEGNCADAVRCCTYFRDGGKTIRDDTDHIVWLATPAYEGIEEEEEPLLPSTMDVHLSFSMERDNSAVTFIEASFHGNEVVYQCSLNRPLCRTTNYGMDGIMLK